MITIDASKPVVYQHLEMLSDQLIKIESYNGCLTIEPLRRAYRESYLCRVVINMKKENPLLPNPMQVDIALNLPEFLVGLNSYLSGKGQLRDVLLSDIGYQFLIQFVPADSTGHLTVNVTGRSGMNNEKCSLEISFDWGNQSYLNEFKLAVAGMIKRMNESGQEGFGSSEF